MDLTAVPQFAHIEAAQAAGMAENEAPTITAPVPVGPASYPTTVQGTYLPAGSATNPVPPAFVPQEELPPGELPPASRNQRPDLMNRLRAPAVAAVTGGVLLLGVGFGAGFVVGRDHAGTGTDTSVRGGPGGMPGGGTGFGNGQGQGGFGGPQGTGGQLQQGQTQPGTGGQTLPDGTTQQDSDGTTQQGSGGTAQQGTGATDTTGLA